jgi:serine/threonine protein kinase
LYSTIGAGAYATVYRAEWNHTDVAVKIIRKPPKPPANGISSSQDLRDAAQYEESLKEAKILV